MDYTPTMDANQVNERFDFRDVFVFDLANNHQGDVAHALRIIREIGEVARKHQVRGIFKFQFRQLDSFIHPAHQKSSDNKHIPRFLATRLDRSQFEILLSVARVEGMQAMCTPFDEESVDVITDMGFDIIKVASCSARDWPLLEKVATAGLPVIVSTGGLTLEQVDDLVSFLDHRACDFALMHCVSIYPTPDAACNLGNIANFRERYLGRTIGWSTHENPADTVPVQLAVALGAGIFERHVGIATDTIKLNAYSSTPEQTDAWIGAWRKAKTLLGQWQRQLPLPEERRAIDDLMRGVFSRVAIKSGELLRREDVCFAFPYTPGQLSSGEFKDGIVVRSSIDLGQPIPVAALDVPSAPDELVIKHAVHEVKALLNQARVTLSSDFRVEYSHHYGVVNFRSTGAVLINVINREYSKKILVQLSGQSHPLHFHKRKEETFLVLWGELHAEVAGRRKLLQPGDTLLVLPGVWHRFWTETGCVFEEISTTHFANDSVYRDPAINELRPEQRKTVVDHWGRFQLSDRITPVSNLAQ